MDGKELGALVVILITFKAMLVLLIKSHWDLVYNIVPKKFDSLQAGLVQAHTESSSLQSETISALKQLNKQIKRLRRDFENKPQKPKRRKREPVLET
jgi:F0F1-type ATP synthase membrane subunit b/b'